MSQPKTFIETQFPVSKLSKESYKERKANHGQTLTGLGKWWGRKPLILVRAAILGLLLPASDDPQKDRETFLRVLTMDEEGLWARKNKLLSATEAYEALNNPSQREEWFELRDGKPTFKRGLTAQDKERIQRRAFNRLNYDAKLEFCARPEEISGPSSDAWVVINAHLGTNASGLAELVQELGQRQFGHTPRVGDAFCGGGSIPFEAARIGCDAFGSDLSPIAALLTWSALNIVGGGPDVAAEVRHALEAVYDEVKRQIEAWGIERNAVGWVADAYLYCHEVRDNGWTVPLAPSWVIGERTRTVARLIPRHETKTFRIAIEQGVDDREMASAKEEGTWANGVRCPVDADGTPIPPTQRRATSGDSLRGRGGLRRWENGDLVPRPADVFQERLYCIRWRLPELSNLLWEEQRGDTDRLLETVRREIDGLLSFLVPAEREHLTALRARDWAAEDSDAAAKLSELESLRALGPKGTTHQAVLAARECWQQAREIVRTRESAVVLLSGQIPETRYAAPDAEDLEREELVMSRLRGKFAEWQAKGYIPSSIIEKGDKTEEPIRTRGYTHWHHLFNPRQLLTLGLFAEIADQMQFKGAAAVGCILATGRLANWNSRLSRWHSHGANEKGEDTFSNQALNTLLNYSTRPLTPLERTWAQEIKIVERYSTTCTQVSDARGDVAVSDLWITDPAYADAVNYEELSEFFLAWYDKRLHRLFPEWYTDSKRALAVRGSDESFRLAMVECYRNFAQHMPDNGLQVVMFTHTDAEVWADLALILWAAGLRVTAAWTIATETEASGLKQGNYVQGTVLLVLRKQTGNAWGDLSDIFPEVQQEVERQMESMTALDDRDDPNFSDSDYQLAAYAAALRVLTGYKEIEEINVDREIRRVRSRNEKSPLAKVIEQAVKIASDYLVPRGIERTVWRNLAADERLYVKGVEVESHGDYRSGVYMEFARGYGVRDYQVLLGSSEANKTRLKTPSEFKSAGLSGEGFPQTTLRQVLFAVYKTGETGDPSVGRDWLRREVNGYWDRRTAIVEILRYLAHAPSPAMTHWAKDQEAAELLAGLIANDSL
jgi:adenine-specific DNA methylase